MALAQETWAVGRSLPRVDGVEKVTGRARYVADLALPGLLVARVLRSPYAHARIVSIDTSRARRVPGVKAVLTAADTPGRLWGASVRDQPVLAADRVRYVGEEVAAVAALDAEAADEALALIEVEYEALPALFDPLAAMTEAAPLLHPTRGSNVVQALHVTRGDAERGLAEADLVIEDTFQSALQFHGSIETIGTVADYAPSGKLTVWMNTQTPALARQRIAYALALDERAVRVVQPHIGGGFGGKNCDDNNVMIAGLLAMRTGRPVKLVNRREEEFQATRPRVPMRVEITMGFRADGTITGKRLRIVADNGAYTAKAPAILKVAALRHDMLFRNANVQTDAYLVYTNNIPTGALRGFGQPSTHFALDQVLDMAAERLGIDPVELHRRNLIGPNSVSVHGHRVTSCEVAQCLDWVAARLGWEGSNLSPPAPLPSEGRGEPASLTPRPPPSLKGRGAGGVGRPLRGRAVSCAVQVSGSRHGDTPEASTATIRLDHTGRAMILSGEGESGQGSRTVLCQIAADAIGLRMADVDVDMPDTDVHVYGRGSVSSRLAYTAGEAVRRAGAELRERLLAEAASLLEANPADLTLVEGRVAVAGTDRGLSVADVARALLTRGDGAALVATAVFDPPSEAMEPQHDNYGNESGAYNFAAHAAEVEVDPDTGQVRVLRYVAATDIGTVLNPMLAEGQVEGGVVQGLGYVLSEGLLYDEGRPLNPNFSDYRLPTMGDVPPFEQTFADSYEPTGPFGAKGVGEISIDCVTGLLANAIADATGVRFRTLPLTAEKIWRALHPDAPPG
jgi:CO/xanthine dehydrogenase Mo-binding subunit